MTTDNTDTHGLKHRLENSVSDRTKSIAGVMLSFFAVVYVGAALGLMLMDLMDGRTTDWEVFVFTAFLWEPVVVVWVGVVATHYLIAGTDGEV